MSPVSDSSVQFIAEGESFLVWADPSGVSGASQRGSHGKPTVRLLTDATQKNSRDRDVTDSIFYNLHSFVVNLFRRCWAFTHQTCSLLISGWNPQLFFFFFSLNILKPFHFKSTFSPVVIGEISHVCCVCRGGGQFLSGMVSDIHILVCRQECKDGACQWGVSERGCSGKGRGSVGKEKKMCILALPAWRSFFRREVDV